jgi:F-type H+/Na+-transporting ATPase subunit alpha
MSFRPEEVSAVIQQELEHYESRVQMESVGSVLQVGDGIARVWGLEDAMAGELIKFPGDVIGMVLNLEPDNVGAVLFGSDEHIKEGDQVTRTGKIAQVPVGMELVGRVVNALGEPLDGKGPIAAKEFRLIEGQAPGVVQRQPVKEPLQTGIKAVDSMIPIGRGQRELIIGDRQTGKTAIIIDTIINQKGTGVYCIYVAIGQKESTVAQVVEVLRKHGALEYTTVVSASASQPGPRSASGSSTAASMRSPSTTTSRSTHRPIASFPSCSGARPAAKPIRGMSSISTRACSSVRPS